MTNKAFDSVEMTRRIRDKMYEETKGLNTDELAADGILVREVLAGAATAYHLTPALA